MDETRYKRLVRTAVTLTVAWIGWTIYDSGLQESSPVALELAAAEKYLEDGNFSEALLAFDAAVKLVPDNIGALRGKGQTLMRMGISEMRHSITLEQSGNPNQSSQKRQQASNYFQQALAIYNHAIDREEQLGISDSNRKALSVSYANRGILKDQQGDHTGALKDYEIAIDIDASVTDGPGLLTRFMRNQPERPPNIADRARYLKQQLALPSAEQIFRIPTEDAQQHAYKLD